MMKILKMVIVGSLVTLSAVSAIIWAIMTVSWMLDLNVLEFTPKPILVFVTGIMLLMLKDMVDYDD